MREIKNTKDNKEKNKKKANNKKELAAFLKEHIIFKTKVLSIIGILFTIFMICLFILYDVNMVDETTTFEKTSMVAMLRERIIILFLILLAGWVPYFYIPAIAYAAYIFMLSGDLLFNMEINGRMLALVINIIPVLVDIFTVSVIAAIAIYICNYTSKKYKYAQRTSFSFLDVKIQLYQMTKKQDEYEEAIAKKEKKIADMEKNDVKIDYMSILKIVPIMMGINLLVCVIEYFIN